MRLLKIINSQVINIQSDRRTDELIAGVLKPLWGYLDMMISVLRIMGRLFHSVTNVTLSGR